MKTIAVANQKGGCGKTTTAINLAASLGQQGQRVLLIDMDAQAHATLGLGKCGQELATLYDVFAGRKSIRDVILHEVQKNLDLLPASMALVAAEHQLSITKEDDLDNYLDPLDMTYDFLIIDCPPALGRLSINALLAADEVLVPIEMSLFSLDGIERLCETLEQLETRRRMRIPFKVLPTMVDNRTKICRMFLRKIWERFPDNVLPIMIHNTVRLKESVCYSLPIGRYDATSSAAVDYDKLAAHYVECNVTRFVKKEADYISEDTTLRYATI